MRTDSILCSVVQYRLGQRDGAMGRIDINRERREALEQLLGGRRQLAFVLISVLGIDDHQRLFAGKRVGTHAVAALEAGGWGDQSALISRNGTVGIGGAFGTDTGQAGAEAGCLVAGYCGLGGMDCCQ
ncbi:hypothetical protein D3C84_624090 [compost metagenome]